MNKKCFELNKDFKKLSKGSGDKKKDKNLYFVSKYCKPVLLFMDIVLESI